MTYEEYCDYSFSDFAEANRHAIEESLRERLGTVDGFEWACDNNLVPVMEGPVWMEDWRGTCGRFEDQYIRKFFWDEAERLWQKSKETSRAQKLMERDGD